MRYWCAAALLTLAVLATTALPARALEQLVIPTRSMMPTLWPGDRFLAVGVTFDADNLPKRGMLVIFTSPRDGVSSWIKRVIGLPGDRIGYVQRRLSVNGVEAEVRALGDGILGERPRLRFYHETLPSGESHRISLIEGMSPRTFSNVTVPEGQVYVLGDNRDNSVDSRQSSFGTVPLSSIRALPILKFWHGPERHFTWQLLQ